MNYRAAWIGAAISVAIACTALALPGASAASIPVSDPAAQAAQGLGAVEPALQAADQTLDQAPNAVGDVPVGEVPLANVRDTVDDTTGQVGQKVDGLVDGVTAPLAAPSPPDSATSSGSAELLQPAVAATAAAAGAATVSVGITAAFPGGRRALTAGFKGMLRALGALGGLGAVGLFSRIQPDQMLEHETRARILDAVSSNPGISLLDLRERMGVAWGTLNHHVHKMQDAGILVSVRQGPRRLLFAAESPEGQARKELALLHVPTARRIAMAVQENPGVRQKDLCESLQLNKPAASKHLARFEAAGLVLVSREGGACHYQPTPRLEAALQWSTVTPTSLAGPASMAGPPNPPDAAHTAGPTPVAAGTVAAAEPVAA